MSRLEIVVPELVDEDIQDLPPQQYPDAPVVEEKLAPQPDLDTYFGVLPTLSTVDSFVTMVSSCIMPSELEFRIPIAEERP